MADEAPAVHRFASLGSTQDALHELAAAGAPAGTAVVADELTAARGSRGRAWAAPAGGLWLSLLVRPAASPAVPLLSVAVGLALAPVLDRVAGGARVMLKWPNDLYLRDRKLGGVLCEARWLGGSPAWVVVGVGINVANPIPGELQDQAVALAEVAPGITSAELVQPVVDALRGVRADAAALTPADLAEFARRDWLRGRFLESPAVGRAAGLAPDGALLVEPDGGGPAVPVASGTVTLRPVAAVPSGPAQ